MWRWEATLSIRAGLINILVAVVINITLMVSLQNVWISIIFIW